MGYKIIAELNEKGRIWASDLPSVTGEDAIKSWESVSRLESRGIIQVRFISTGRAFLCLP
jgi:hypothetical protein